MQNFNILYFVLYTLKLKHEDYWEFLHFYSFYKLKYLTNNLIIIIRRRRTKKTVKN